MIFAVHNSPLHESLRLQRNGRMQRSMFIAILLSVLCGIASAQQLSTIIPGEYGPYNGIFLADGLGLRIPLVDAHDSVLLADAPLSIY